MHRVSTKNKGKKMDNTSVKVAFLTISKEEEEEVQKIWHVKSWGHVMYTLHRLSEESLHKKNGSVVCLLVLETFVRSRYASVSCFFSVESVGDSTVVSGRRYFTLPRLGKNAPQWEWNNSYERASSGSAGSRKQRKGEKQKIKSLQFTSSFI